MANEKARAQEGKIFPEKKLQGQQIIRLGPLVDANIPTVTIKSETIVIWINDLPQSMFEIQFLGKQVTMACQSPVHFVVDNEGSFISNKIPSGAVASLCFIEKGTFAYIARKLTSTTGPSFGLGPSPTRTAREIEFKGKIIVE